MEGSLYAPLISRQRLSMMCDITEKVQTIVDAAKEKSIIITACSKTGQDTILSNNISGLSLCVTNFFSCTEEILKDSNLLLHEWVDPINQIKQGICDALYALELKLKCPSTTHVEMEEKIIDECNDIHNLCMRYAQSIDEFEVERLKNACNNVRQALDALCSGIHPNLILETVWELKNVILRCLDLAYARFKDLVSPDNYNLMLSSMSSLKRTLSILKESLIAIHETASDGHAFVSGDYILKKADLALQNIVKAAGFMNAECDDMAEKDDPGDFGNCIDQIIQMIEGNKDSNQPQELHILLNKVVAHSLAISQFSTPNSQMNIRRFSQAVLLHSSSSVNSHNLEVGLTNTTKTEPRLNLGELLTVVASLEREVNQAMLELIVRLLVDPMQPVYEFLERTLKTLNLNTSLVEETHDIQEPSRKFHDYADWMYQICKFACSISRDKRFIHEIHLTVMNMELIDIEMVPAVVMCLRCPHNKGTFSHLKLLVSEWYDHIDFMQDSFLRFLDVPALLKIIDDLIHQQTHTISKFLHDQVSEVIEEATVKIQKLAECAVRIIIASPNYVKCSKPEYFQKLIKDIRKSTRSVKKSFQDVSNSLADLEAHRLLQKHSKILSSCIHTLQVECERLSKEGSLTSFPHSAYLEDCSEVLYLKAEEDFQSTVFQPSSKNKNDILMFLDQKENSEVSILASSRNTKVGKHNKSGPNDLSISSSSIELNALLDSFQSFNIQCSNRSKSSPVVKRTCVKKTETSLRQKLFNSMLIDITNSQKINNQQKGNQVVTSCTITHSTPVSEKA